MTVKLDHITKALHNAREALHDLEDLLGDCAPGWTRDELRDFLAEITRLENHLECIERSAIGEWEENHGDEY